MLLLAFLRNQLGLLPHRPKLISDKMFIRKDEFHRSLDIDCGAMMKMNAAQKANYLNDLTRRRNIAHNRDSDFRDW